MGFTMAGDTLSNAAINSELETAGKLKHLSFSMHGDASLYIVTSEEKTKQNKNNSVHN